MLPRIGGGLIAAYEVMIANHAVRNLVREGKTRQLRNVVSTHQNEGMQTIEMALNDLVASGEIEYETALNISLYPKELDKPAPVLNERTIAALDAAPTIGGLIGGKQRSRGLRLFATDTDWVRGTGPTIEGPAEMLLLAITGRPAALPQLEGEGVAVLAGRIGG